MVTRTSPGSVTVGLECDKHDHEGYIVGRIEGQQVGVLVGESRGALTKTTPSGTPYSTVQLCSPKSVTRWTRLSR